MREIKFRVWDREFKKIRTTGMGINHGVLTSDDVIMQYTGLKDKTGKDVYEGDILSVSGMGISGVVMFVDGGYRWDVGSKTQTPSLLVQERTKNLHIIGNIYENPGLLK